MAFPTLTPRTQQDFLDLFERILPKHYLGPIKASGPGYELLQAFALVAARVSQAIAHVSDGSFLWSAGDGAKAVVSATFSRAAPAAVDYVIKAGTRVSCSVSKRQFVTTADLAFPLASVGPLSVAAEAVIRDWQHNVAGQVTAADGEVLPGEIDTIELLRLEQTDGTPDYVDTFAATNLTAATGGAAAMLDQLGADRGVPRRAGESADAYRRRAWGLPDTVSPGAISRLMHATFDPIANVSWRILETFEVDYQTCWDAPNIEITSSGYNANLFVYDDPRGTIPLANRWIGVEDANAAFYLVVPRMQPFADVGPAYDDTASVVADCYSADVPGGWRSVAAYDLPGSLVLPGCAYDGEDFGEEAFLHGLYDSLIAAKAAGVYATLVREGD